MTKNPLQSVNRLQKLSSFPLLLIIMALLLSACQSEPAPVELSIPEKIDQLLAERLDPLGPGAVVLVLQGEEVVYHGTYGKADIESGLDMDVDHVFALASITKEFTAAAILQLEDKGLLSTKDDIHLYLPDYPTEGHSITIEHLLTHTSGIHNHMDMEWASGPLLLEFDSARAVIEHFKTDSLDFLPGEKYTYSNSGFLILGYIIEQVSGFSYEDYIKKNLLDPSGMTNASYPRDASEIQHLSTGYESMDGTLVEARKKSLSQNYGQTGLFGTALDLSKWYAALNSYKILPEETLKRAWTTYRLNDGRPTNYGLGWNVENKLGSPTISHTGFMFGHSSTDLYYPEEGLLVLVLSNVGAIRVVNTNELAFDISSYFFEGRILQLTEEELDQFTGIYKMEPGFDTKVYREGTQLYVMVDEDRPDKVVAVAPNRFKVKDFDAAAEFTKDDSGDYTHLILSRGEVRLEGVKKESAE